MATRLHPYSFDPWVSQQTFATNPYGAYYPLPIVPDPSAAKGRLSSRFPEPGHKHCRSSRPSLKSRPANKKTTVEGPEAFPRVPMKKSRRKGAKRRRNHRVLRDLKNHRNPPIERHQQAEPLDAGVDQLQASPAVLRSVRRTPCGTPVSTLRCFEDASQLNVDPYGTMAGMIELQHGASSLFAPQNEERVCVYEDSVDGPSSSSSEGDAGDTTATAAKEGVEGNQPTCRHSPPRVLPNLRSGFFLNPPRQGDTFLRARLEEQEVQMNQLEEENLTLKEKLFLIEQELEELRRRASGSSAEEMEGDNSVICGGERSS